VPAAKVSTYAYVNPIIAVFLAGFCSTSRSTGGWPPAPESSSGVAVVNAARIRVKN